MPDHIKRIACCYCGTTSLINLDNPEEMRLICPGCGAKMCVEKLAPLARAATPRRDIVFEPGPKSPPPCGGRPENRDGYRGKPRRRRSFLKRLEDVWDEIEDIFD